MLQNNFNNEATFHAEQNKDVTRSTEKQARQKLNEQKYSTAYQKGKIKITLVFPENTDQKAENEFVGRLKEIYLRKIEIGAMQAETSALESNSSVNSVDLEAKDKEDKNHE